MVCPVRLDAAVHPFLAFSICHLVLAATFQIERPAYGVASTVLLAIVLQLCRAHRLGFGRCLRPLDRPWSPPIRRLWCRSARTWFFGFLRSSPWHWQQEHGDSWVMPQFFELLPHGQLTIRYWLQGALQLLCHDREKFTICTQDLTRRHLGETCGLFPRHLCQQLLHPNFVLVVGDEGTLVKSQTLSLQRPLQLKICGRIHSWWLYCRGQLAAPSSMSPACP